MGMRMGEGDQELGRDKISREEGRVLAGEERRCQREV